MANSQIRLSATRHGFLKRPTYGLKSYLNARDLSAEQKYRQQRLMHHNRYLHHWGIICGLRVTPAQDPLRPWAIQVCPGYAIGCCGEEIELLRAHTIDVRDYLWMQSRDHKGPAYVCIRYDEELRHPVPSYKSGCGCEETQYEASRIQDAFQVDVLWSLSENNQAKRFDLCTKDLAPCPECTDCPYVILARINLPASDSVPITQVHIETEDIGL